MGIKKVSVSELLFKKGNNSSNKMNIQNVKDINIKSDGFIINHSRQVSTEEIHEYESMGARVNLPYQDGIFGPEAIKAKQFGGNQGSLIKNISKYISDPKIKEIVSKYYPDYDAEDLELLFFRMNTVGCGYVAAINTLLFEYGYFQDKHSPDDFSNRFGFPIEGFENGYNFDYLFLDFFLFYAKEVEGYKTIEEVYGNAMEERKQTSGDGAVSHSDFKQTGMGGTYAADVSFAMKKYLESKGININVKTKNDFVMNREEKIKRIEEDKQHGIEWNEDILDDDYIMYKNVEEILPELLPEVFNDISLVMVVSAYDYPLYYPEDIDGNGKLDDVYDGDVGGHGMTVVGPTDDPNKIVVSSWGEEFVMDISDIEDFAVYDYSDFNGV